jgi:endo-1,4-beta-xylanase
MRSRGRKYMGTALTVRNDANETAIISNPRDFNSITPENAQKWDQIQPARNQFTFSAADQHVEYAGSRGYRVHCHTLVWHSQLPTWVSNGGFDNATLIEVMREHINQVAGRYKGKCAEWDVVNEGSYSFFSFIEM